MARQLQIRVKPRSSRTRLEQQADGSWVAWLQAPPVEGRANAALERLVAEHFGLPRSRVSVVAGARSRSKRVSLGED